MLKVVLVETVGYFLRMVYFEIVRIVEGDSRDNSN